MNGSCRTDRDHRFTEEKRWRRRQEISCSSNPPEPAGPQPALAPPNQIPRTHAHGTLAATRNGQNIPKFSAVGAAFRPQPVKSITGNKLHPGATCKNGAGRAEAPAAHVDPAGVSPSLPHGGTGRGKGRSGLRGTPGSSPPSCPGTHR